MIEDTGKYVIEDTLLISNSLLEYFKERVAYHEKKQEYQAAKHWVEAHSVTQIAFEVLLEMIEKRL